jgi:hypothetical protein
MNYAAAWNDAQTPHPFADRELVAMATTTPADLIGASDRLGALEPGHDADVLVVRPEAQAGKHDAYWTLTHATAAQVMLVMVGGEPLYGDPDLIEKTGPSRPSEKIEVCGSSKTLLFTGLHGQVDAADETWAHTASTLQTALRHYGRNLAPLAECGQ